MNYCDFCKYFHMEVQGTAYPGTTAGVRVVWVCSNRNSPNFAKEIQHDNYCEHHEDYYARQKTN